MMTVSDISSNSIDVMPGSGDQVQGNKDTKHSGSFADLFASAKGTSGTLTEKSDVGHDKSIESGTAKSEPSKSSPAGSTPALKSIEEKTPQTVPEKAEGEDGKNLQAPKDSAKTDGVNETQGRPIKLALKRTDAPSATEVAQDADIAAKLEIAKAEGGAADPDKATDKGKGIHAKVAHKLVLMTSHAVESNSFAAQATTPPSTSQAALTPPGSPLPAAIPAALSPSSTQDVASKDAPPVTPALRTSIAVTGAGKHAVAIAGGEDAVAAGRVDSLMQKATEHEAAADDQGKMSSPSVEPTAENQAALNAGIGSFKETQALQQVISPPMAHSVTVAGAKVADPGNNDVSSPMRQMQIDTDTANQSGQMHIVSDRMIEISVPDSQHGPVSVRAELQSDGSVAAQLLPRSVAGHVSLVSQTNGLSAYLSEHSLSLSVSVVAPAASSGGNLPPNNASGHAPSDAMQFTQHREERGSADQGRNNEKSFDDAVTAPRDEEVQTRQTAQTLTQYTNRSEAGRPGWISIRV
ncbi:hypothetical protein [Terriglobus saanensis]|nr:hypothetical protein [Terriglobus saanensis]